MTWILLLFAYALLFAMVEIEIEGADGWAEKLPTWYRITPWYAQLMSVLLSGKPATGYHLMMFPIPIVSFHLGLCFGMPWSWALEARLFAAYLVFNVIWDFLWFVLNPHFGWQRFRKGAVWLCHQTAPFRNRCQPKWGLSTNQRKSQITLKTR